MLYEIGDPSAYVLPDVVCDWRYVKITELPAKSGAINARSNRVLVTGAKGRPPTEYYKVSVTAFDGFRMSGSLVIGGIEAAKKAQAVGEAVLSRVRRIMKMRGMEDFVETNIEVLGAEHTYGPHSRARDAREVVLRISVYHKSDKALTALAQELAPTATSMAPGISGGGDGRPHASPVMRFYSSLVLKSKIPVTTILGDSKSTPELFLPPISGDISEPTPVSISVLDEGASVNPSGSLSSKLVQVPLVAICFGRSGDKGDMANIGLIARSSQFYPFIKHNITEKVVYDYMKHLVKGKVKRYELPGVFALNFLLTKSLGSGGVSSLRIDRQGKTYAQMLLSLQVTVPVEWVNSSQPKL